MCEKSFQFRPFVCSIESSLQRNLWRDSLQNHLQKLASVNFHMKEKSQYKLHPLSRLKISEFIENLSICRTKYLKLLHVIVSSFPVEFCLKTLVLHMLCGKGGLIWDNFLQNILSHKRCSVYHGKYLSV